MAKIELSPEVRAIESLIDAREQLAASQRMQAAQGRLGRRPEYRYLLCLYDATFRTRSDAELVREVTALVGDQPDMAEASALLAELCARTGDRARAELFARSAVESGSPSRSVSSRAAQVLKDVPGPGREVVLSPLPKAQVKAPTLDASELEQWFELVRVERVHHRSAAYGVRPDDSIVDMLLDWGRSVALGGSFASSSPLPLSRESLMVLDEAILAFRRQPGGLRGAKADTSRATAAAGFFLAVVLHELNANVIEIAANDGGCKAILPSGAGARPLLVAAAFCDGKGPSLLQSFDRLATASELAGSEAPGRTASSGRMQAAKPAAPGSIPAPAFEELALSRAEAEAAPLRRLERPVRPSASPALDMSALAATLATSPVGRAIAERSGAYVSPTPASVEALETYCTELRGTIGEAPLAEEWLPVASEEALIASWGAFLGEALIAAYGGVWERDPVAPTDPRLFRVICEDRAVAWPVTQVYLRLKNGARHDLAAFVAAMDRLLS